MMMNILLKDIVIQVRCGTTIGEEIQTKIYVPQGNCASTVVFILYLAQAFKPKTPVITRRAQIQHNNNHHRSDHATPSY